MKHEARDVNDAELAESDLEQVTGGIIDGNAGQAARDVVRNWLFHYQMKRYHDLSEFARKA